MRISICMVFLLTAIIPATAQYIVLDDTVDVFGTKVMQLLEGTGNREAADIGQDFSAHWSTAFSDSQQQAIIDIALEMQERKLSRHSYFADFFAVLNSAVSEAGLGGVKLDNMLDMLAGSLEMQPALVFGKSLGVLRVFFEKGALHHNRNNRLWTMEGQYDFEFVPPARQEEIVYMPEVQEEPAAQEEGDWDTGAQEGADGTGDKDPWGDGGDNWSADDDWNSEDDWSSDGWDDPVQAVTEVNDDPKKPDVLQYEQAGPPVVEEGAIIRFEQTHLVFATRYDSVAIEGTSGALLIDKDIFTGKGGEVNWTSAGLEANAAYVLLDTYHFDTRRPYMQAGQATLHYDRYLERPANGLFEFRSIRHDSIGDATFPRFTSYDNANRLRGFANKNLQYTGGFALKGSRVYGLSLYNQSSTLQLDGTDGRRFRVQARQYAFLDTLVQARQAAIVVYHGRDSIVHPSVKFRYYYGSNTLVAVKELDGYRVRPFNSSYYNMTIDADMIRWDIDTDSMDISVMNARTMLPAVFKSKEYFAEDDITDLTGVYRFNPLLMVYNFATKSRSREIYIDDVAKKLKLNERAVRASMQELAYLDFIDYEDVSGRIYIKDKAIHYVRSKNNAKDFDDLLINSLTHDGPNATLDLSSEEMKVRGIEKFFISEMLDVYIYPVENSIKLLKNRDFKFDGQLFAGNFEFVGRDFTFRYDSFLVDLQQIDSIKFYVDTGQDEKVQVDNKMVSARDNTQEETRDLSFLQGGTTGTLYINRPDNKSGKRFFPQYPVFDAERGAVVYFNDENTLDGAYDQSVYFVVPPFAIDSLSSSDPAAIGFTGTFVSGGLMPEFDETMRIMEDNSLGFTHNIPEQGYQIYNGKGKLYDRIRLNKDGLVGSGKIEYLSGSVRSDSITYYLDSAVAETVYFSTQKGDFQNVSYPDVQVDSASMTWVPGADRMLLENKADLFDLYGATASFDGSVELTPQGMHGAGTMMTRGFVSESEAFEFEESNMMARNAFFDLKSENPEKPLLSGDDIRLNFDFEENIAELSPEIEGVAAIDFPYAQFKTSISKALWNLEEGKVFMTKPEDVDIENSYFYATREELDSLAFNAEAAEYDLETSALKVSGIPHIVVADAYVIPEHNEVLILENATIGELSNTTIVIDTLNEYHRLVDGTINIRSRTEFTGQATYQYVNALNDTFNIDFRKFELWKDPEDRRGILQTVSSGAVLEDNDLLISEGVYFKGDAKMYARNKALELDGFVKLDLRSKPDYDTWIQYRSQDEYAQEVQFVFEQAVTESGNMLSAGIHHESLSKDLYFTFADEKKLDADDDFFRAGGILSYDAARDLYVIQDTAKAFGSAFSGKIFTYNDANGDITFEGPVQFIRPEEHLQAMAAGFGTGNINSLDLNAAFLVKFDFDIPDQAWTIMAADVYEVAENFGFAEAEPDNDAFLYKVSEIIGERATAEYDQRSREDYIPIASFSSRMIGGLVFSKLPMSWSAEYNSWYSTGKLGLSNILRYDINSQLDGFLEIRRTEEKGDVVNIFIQASAACWYYFSYDDGRLSVYSSNNEFNAFIEDKSNVDKASFGEYVFLQGDLQDALDYANRFRSEYLGIKQPYEINVPVDQFQETVDIFADPEVDQPAEEGFGDTDDLGFGPADDDLGFGPAEDPSRQPTGEEQPALQNNIQSGPTDNGQRAAPQEDLGFGFEETPVDHSSDKSPEQQAAGDEGLGMPAGEKPSPSTEEKDTDEDLGFGAPPARDSVPTDAGQSAVEEADPLTAPDKKQADDADFGVTDAPQGTTPDGSDQKPAVEDLGFGLGEPQDGKEDLGFGAGEQDKQPAQKEDKPAGDDKDNSKKEKKEKQTGKKKKEDDRTPSEKEKAPASSGSGPDEDGF
jgi:hypothetical protein